MNIDELIRILQQEGECMGVQEIAECLQLLVQDSSFKQLPQEISAEEFAENILGLEEVEEIEEEEGEFTQQDAMGGSYSAALGAGLHNEVIPEEDV